MSSASGLSQVWGQSWRGQTQCPELLWGAVHTQSQVDGALWPASPQQHQQCQRASPLGEQGFLSHEHLRSQPREKMDPVGQIARPETDPILGSRGLGDRAWPEIDPAPPCISGQGGRVTELGWRQTLSLGQGDWGTELGPRQTLSHQASRVKGGPGTELGWRHTPSTPGISGRGCPGNDSYPEAPGLSPSLAAQQLRGFGQAACVWTSAS